jgi:chromosome segregation ATPase
MVAFSERSRPVSPIRGGLMEPEFNRPQASSTSHLGRSDPLDRSLDGLLKAPVLPKDLGNAQRAFEHVQTELMLQSRRQDELFEFVAKVEADLSRVAKLAVENEGLHATERQQKQSALSNLTRKTEDAVLTCESLRKGQEHLIHKVERLEAFAEDRDRSSEEVRLLQREVDALQGTVREKLDTFGHALRRLDAMEQIFDENTKLRQEVAQLRRANERRDLEMAAVQGQIDALTKLVREQLREPLSPPRVDTSLVC